MRYASAVNERGAAELYALPYSPWSEKARWALDHHRVPYREREYVPMLGEASLRIRLRRPRGRVTVPVLFADGGALTDSFEIASWADTFGDGARLMPDDRAQEIGGWNRRSERALDAARGLLVPRLLADRDAQREALPAIFPAPVRGALTPAAALGSRFVRRKYAIPSNIPAHRGAYREVLLELRGALGDGDHLVGDAFSFADLAMAVALQGVTPPADRHLAMGPASRRCWTDDELTGEFADLVAWRDRIYERHRR